ncbi:catalytic protein [Stachybotrys elegans]|uniref:Catalytic protein n=1 Tax=Stachybotrys elegans TaxID=80388 RepID=A0A8K0SGG7_9HYPO|nr:catalytic protein [Stachybotrys elegans]
MTQILKPSILFVQGSFQIPEVYSRLTAALEARHFHVVHPKLPSLIGQEKPDFATKSLVEDAEAVQSELKRLVEVEGKPVLVVMHSYGGLVGSQAVPEELTWAKRNEKGLAGGVIHLFYFAAFILTIGQSVLGTFGESSNNIVYPDGRFSLKDAANILYNDLPPKEAQFWESKIINQSYAVQSTEVTRAAYLYLPSTYMICQNDQAAPAQYQEMFAATAHADILKIEAGHSPWFTKNEELVDSIEKTATEAFEKLSKDCE